MKHIVRTRKDLGHLVREARKARGWTQGELAKRTKTTQKSVSLLESGQTDAKLDTVLRALAVLRVQLSGDITPEQKPGVGTEKASYPSAYVLAQQLKRQLAPLEDLKQQIDKSLEPYKEAQAVARRASEEFEKHMRPLNSVMDAISKQRWYENYSQQLDRMSSILPDMKDHKDDD